LKKSADYNKKPFSERDSHSRISSNIVGGAGGVTGALGALDHVRDSEHLTPIQKGLITGGVGLAKGLIFKAGFRHFSKPKK